MYFRQEAMKALWQYNGCDIEYNSDFLKIQTRQQNKSADLPHNYFARAKYINEVEDSYIMAQVGKHDYRHLSGGEIVYYPNRQEFRVWNHVPAIDVDDQSDTSASSFGGRGLMASNMRYLEDRWKVQINPLLITYKMSMKERILLRLYALQKTLLGKMEQALELGINYLHYLYIIHLFQMQ